MHPPARAKGEATAPLRPPPPAHVERALPLLLDPGRVHDAEVRALGDGACEIATTGGDPYVYTAKIAEPFDPDELHVVAFEYFCPSGLDAFQVFFGPPISERRSAWGEKPAPSETWVPYALDVKLAAKSWGGPVREFRFDFGRRAGKVFRIRRIRLRNPTPEEREAVRLRAGREDARARRGAKLAEYLDSTMPASITRVAVGEERIAIEGRVSAGTSEVLVAEVPMHAGVEAYESPVTTTPTRAVDGGFRVEVDRFSGPPGALRDRLLSRWAIVARRGGTTKRVSALHHATEIASTRSPKRMRPKSQKGMGGIGWFPEMMDDLVELGVHSITVNVVLNHMMSLTPGPDTLPHELCGKTYHFRRKRVEHYDRLLRFAYGKGMVVSAIILLPPESGERRRVFTHPEFDPSGRYSMPNLTTAEGVEHYAAALDFLARRYSREDGKHGRITHWIMQNEVDAGWVWTNAGEQGVRAYMDLYHRSMRVAYATARRYDPHAQVFISLTHHWSKPGSRRFYSPREMLELLTKWSSREGDFQWGVAYHPYPRNLRDPRTWEDRGATFDFDTPFITFRNIEVLDAWMRGPERLYLGREVRTILLSEQGLNSRDYSEESLRLQAAGLAYALAKVRPLRSVEAFHYHRWIDHSKEGGLLLGLWTLKDGTVTTAGRKKPAWDVLAAFGTRREGAATRFAEDVIGMPLSRAPYRGTIGE